MRIALHVLTLFSAASAFAQNVPPPPPSTAAMPTENSPSLEATARFIQDKLNEQGKVNYVSTQHDSRTNTVSEPKSASQTMFDVDVNPASCVMSVNTMIVSPGVRQDRRMEFSFRDTENITVSSWADALNRINAEGGHPEPTYEFAPPIFSLKVQMLKAKRVRIHTRATAQGQQDKDREENLELTFLFFRDEEMAQRVARAMVHATELCGGGSKDPF